MTGNSLCVANFVVAGPERVQIEAESRTRRDAGYI